MTASELLEKITFIGASDIFIVAGLPISYRIYNQVIQDGDERLMPGDTAHMIREFYALADNRDISLLEKNGDDDFSFTLSGVARFRVNAYRQRGSLSAVIRIINFNIPEPKELGFSKEDENCIIELANLKKGFVLVTGPAGSGKSTTLACMIDHINKTRRSHIITLEDPLEYLHLHKNSIVSQREVTTDTDNYLSALKASLRQSPDVILLGEMPDRETMNLAITASETGRLILSSLHTVGAVNTIDRIIDSFPSMSQQQIAIQLSSVLQAIVSQQLVPTVDGNVVPVFEIMIMTPEIKALLRDLEIVKINDVIDRSTNPRMVSMDESLLKLYREGVISAETAVEYAIFPEMMQKKL